MENQTFEVTKLKVNKTRIDTTIQLLHSNVKKSNKQIRDYQKSIGTFSELYDEITKEKQS